ncbi:WD40 repeat-like protein [Amniculicola lignicola CBS 123094]|uniref:WD40 repeat-like protein n=1 Tax=Amniculicola lignicola CBS 123094 TaxID=1392246 RepID=A0A6A5WT15_9PLEO|nr:WD40 repeat-like protein [Amniculicola lignicola CBS 123094]
MAPVARGKSLSKATFPPHFTKLRTTIYNDRDALGIRPGVVVSPNHYIRSLSWNAFGTLIATGSHDRTLRVWNPERAQVKQSTELRGTSGAVERVAFHPLNETELASCGSDGMVRFWDVRTKASTGEVKVEKEPFTLAWTPDGSDIVAGRKDNLLMPISRSAMKVISEHPQSVQTNQTVFDWNGTHLYVTMGDGCVKILDYPTMKSRLTLTAHTSSCYTLSLSPSGEYLAIGGGDALVSLWDTEEWMCVRSLDLTEGPVKSVDFSFDGSYLVAGSDDDKKIEIAHVETGEIVHTVNLNHTASQVAWHPSRYALAYSAEAQGLKIIGATQNSKMDVQAAFNPTTLFSAKGLAVVITGGGSGIGLAIAASLYQTGASKIYLLGRRANILDDAIKTLKASPNAPKDTAEDVLISITCDVTSIGSLSAAVTQITNEIGYVDVLINCAGILGPKTNPDLYQADSITKVRDAMLTGWDQWDGTFRINTQAVIGVSASFLPLLEAANTRRGFQSGKVVGDGNPRIQDTSALEQIGADKDDDRLAQIITVASVASYMRYSTAGLAYNASKSAALHLSKILATFLAEWGIRSNVVCPGPFPSVMTAGLNPKYGTSQIPQGRMGNANDVAGVTLFFVGKGGAYANGMVQVTDGGRLAVWPGTY